VATSGAGAERRRMAEADERGVPWRRWGPYLAERQWGTVREDDGTTGDPWTSFTHGRAHSRAIVGATVGPRKACGAWPMPGWRQLLRFHLAKVFPKLGIASRAELIRQRDALEPVG
jgi:hypothetical protein